MYVYSHSPPLKGYPTELNRNSIYIIITEQSQLLSDI